MHSCWRGTIALLLLSLSSDSVRCLTEERRGGGRGQTDRLCLRCEQREWDGRTEGRGEERRGRRETGEAAEDRSVVQSVARSDGRIETRVSERGTERATEEEIE